MKSWQYTSAGFGVFLLIALFFILFSSSLNDISRVPASVIESQSIPATERLHLRHIGRNY